MAQIETKGTEHPTTTVKLEKGEKIALCRCFTSKHFPECDGSHRYVPGKGPAIVSALKENPDA